MTYRPHKPLHSAAASRLGPQSAAHGEMVEKFIQPINIDMILLQALEKVFGESGDSLEQPRKNVFEHLHIALEKATGFSERIQDARAKNKSRAEIQTLESERSIYTRRFLGKEQDAQFYRELTDLVKVELQRQTSKELNQGNPDGFYLDMAREKFAAVLSSMKAFNSLRGETMGQRLDGAISTLVTEALHHPEKFQGRAFSALTRGIPNQ